MKARALRIDVDLLEYLWSKLIKTIDYLANRTFMTKHEWKTLYELIIEKSSNLFHLHQYDCKVYFLNKHIARKRKLQERAHIEHLMKYKASNIFRIWISSQRKIIRTQDVMFDENFKYDAHGVDLIQAITEFMLKTVYEVHNLNILTRIIEIESNDDEVEKVDEKFSISSFHSLDKTSASEIQSKNQLVLLSSSSSRSVLKSIIDQSIDSKKKVEKEKKKMIELNLDQINILSEEVFRVRASRKQVYRTNLINAAHEEIAVYHIAFFAFFEAKHYYLSNTAKTSSKSSFKDSS